MLIGLTNPNPVSKQVNEDGMPALGKTWGTIFLTLEASWAFWRKETLSGKTHKCQLHGAVLRKESISSQAQ